MQQTVPVVDAEQERTDDWLLLRVAESADDAIGGAKRLDLLHPRALPGLIRQIHSLCDDSVQARPAALEPLFRFRCVRRCRREPQRVLEIIPGELFKQL